MFFRANQGSISRLLAGGWIHFQTGRRTAKRQQVFHNVAAARDKPLFQVGLERVYM